jgi:hypothetical protein
LFFLSAVPTKSLPTLLLSSMRTTCQARLIVIGLVTRTVFRQE